MTSFTPVLRLSVVVMTPPKWNDAQRQSDGNLTNFAKTGLLEAGKNCAQGLLSSLNEAVIGSTYKSLTTRT